MSSMKYPCPHCGKFYGTKHSYLEHLNCHSNLRPHRCKVCGLTFSYRSSLYNHSRVHSLAKPFVCSYCGIGFRWKNSRQIHEKKCRSKPVGVDAEAPPAQRPAPTQQPRRHGRLTLSMRTPELTGPEMDCVFGVINDVRRAKGATTSPAPPPASSTSTVPWSPCPFCNNLFQLGAALTRHMETCDVRPKEASATVSFNLGVDPVENGWLDVDMDDEEPAQSSMMDLEGQVSAEGTSDTNYNYDDQKIKTESVSNSNSDAGSSGFEEPEYRMTLTLNDQELAEGRARRRNPKHLSALERIVASIHQSHTCTNGADDDNNGTQNEANDPVSSTTNGDVSGSPDSGPCPGVISLETLARQQAELHKDLASLKKLLAVKLGSIEVAVNQLKTTIGNS